MAAVDSLSAFEIEPRTPLLDQSVSIRLVGLPPGAIVTLRARLEPRWESRAVFAADSVGTIDLDRDAPLEGTYEGIDPVGLLWSMGYEGEDPWLSLADTTKFTTTLHAELDGVEIASVEIDRVALLPGIEVVDVSEGRLRGVFFSPVGGPHAAILVLTGSVGGVPSLFAALLASHGFAALALPYMVWEDSNGAVPPGLDDLPRTFTEIPLEYFEEALAWLKSQPSVDVDRIGAWGISKGGELALLLGATLPDLRAVVGLVPSGVAFMGFGSDFQSHTPDRPSWCYRGQAVPFVPTTPSAAALLDDATGTQFFEACLEDRGAVERATIPVERINGPVLLISAGEDAAWPSSRLSEIAMERMRRHRHGHYHEHLTYERAGHVIIPGRLPIPSLGGDMKATSDAGADSWDRTVAFFHEHLAE
jgi:dienelactone hydrolase